MKYLLYTFGAWTLLWLTVSFFVDLRNVPQWLAITTLLVSAVINIREMIT